MKHFNIMFAIYVPAYIYSLLILFTVIFIWRNMGAQVSPTMQNFHILNRTTTVSLLFFITFMSLLGTPPTLGFFGKILTFFIIIQKGSIYLVVSLILTLILIIFYLQAFRTRALLRKRLVNNRSSNRDTAQLSIFIILALFFILFNLTIPYILDIFYSMVI